MLDTTHHDKTVESPSEATARPPLRVAVSSETERLVDSHFGKASVFMIFEVDAAESRLLERRPVEEVEGGGSGGNGGRSAQRVELIADCDAVVTTRVGPHAQELLDARGVLCVEYPYMLEKGLRYALQQWEAQGGRQPKNATANS